ncbi:hypothetical protein J8273_6174 [Carpediemonas membranifera]|uniref:Uncharacterized protein n=1 Tax=Carpediemonas membranifera TaxID=201153 RepID=A0A8J6B059_9EUKA|nr:hypothetical protein J8273_6174 [Carpediemonas membranifera]|eukprot:KAG9391414.1 hypothetical protein J8273_6174 [Carpediemonas membranifera]
MGGELSKAFKGADIDQDNCFRDESGVIQAVYNADLPSDAGTKAMSILELATFTEAAKCAAYAKHPHILPVEKVEGPTKNGHFFVLTPHVVPLAATADMDAPTDSQVLLGIISIAEALHFYSVHSHLEIAVSVDCICRADSDEWLFCGWHRATKVRGDTPVPPPIRELCEVVRSFLAECYPNTQFPGFTALLLARPATVEDILSAPCLRAVRYDLYQGIGQLALQGDTHFYDKLSEAVDAGTFSDNYTRHRLLPLLSDYLSLGKDAFVPAVLPWCRALDRVEPCDFTMDLIRRVIKDTHVRAERGSVDELSRLTQGLASVVQSYKMPGARALLPTLKELAPTYLVYTYRLTEAVMQQYQRDGSRPREEWSVPFQNAARDIMAACVENIRAGATLQNHRLMLFYCMRLTSFLQTTFKQGSINFHDLIDEPVEKAGKLGLTKTSRPSLISLVLQLLSLPEYPPNVPPQEEDSNKRMPLVAACVVELISALPRPPSPELTDDLIAQIVSSMTTMTAIRYTVMAPARSPERVQARAVLAALVGPENSPGRSSTVNKSIRSRPAPEHGRKPVSQSKPGASHAVNELSRGPERYALPNNVVTERKTPETRQTTGLDLTGVGMLNFGTSTPSTVSGISPRSALKHPGQAKKGTVVRMDLEGLDFSSSGTEDSGTESPSPSRVESQSASLAKGSPQPSPGTDEPIEASWGVSPTTTPTRAPPEEPVMRWNAPSRGRKKLGARRIDPDSF